MNVVKVKFVEVGTLSVKQQILPGMGEGNKVPFRREFGSLTIDITAAIDMASAAVSHTYKRNRFQCFVVNSKNNREELAFDEQGQSETNPDELVQEEKSETKLTIVEGDEGEQEGKGKNKRKNAAEG